MLKFKTIDKLIKENNLKGEMHKNVVKFIDNMDKSNIGKHGNENLKALSGINKNYKKIINASMNIITIEMVQTLI